MVIGGVESVFMNTIDELSKNPDLIITIITHAKIREPKYVDWLKTHPEIPVYVYYPLCNWFEDLAPKCHGVFKVIRKISFGLYKKYRRLIWHNKFKNIDIFVDFKNFEFFKELRHIKKPKIAWTHSAMSYFETNKSISRAYAYDEIVGITDDFISDFNQAHPDYTGHTTRIYNPVDVKLIQERADMENHPKGKYFCHVSRLVAGKDIKTLLDAFNDFAETHRGIKLYIVGDGDMGDKYKKYASTLKANKSIIFTGAMKNPYGIMRGAISNILSSQFEGFGMVLVESMALGRPIISSNCKSGPCEILENGSSGLLFDVGNSKQLTVCMAKVYKDDAFTNKLIKHATHSLTRFNPDDISDQITNLLHRAHTGAK